MASAVGQEAVSDWQTITQNDTNQLAEVTGDKDSLHVDTDVASQTPYGTTIVHGLHLLADGTAAVELAMADRRIQLRSELRLEPTAISRRTACRVACAHADHHRRAAPSGARLVVELTFEPEHGDKPVCVSDSVFQFFS